MNLYCTRPGCLQPLNSFTDLDDLATLKTVSQKYCSCCGMPLILLGRYLPLKLLGRGGFGTAFLARDRYTPGLRQCVVKQFQPAVNLTPEQFETAKELFEREGEALETLGNAHPWIPDLFAFFELTVSGLPPTPEETFFYLVQEFIDGQTMEEEVAQKGLLTSDEVLDMLAQVLPILTFIHERGAIHQDIKPSNIMRHRNGQFYLLDFGSAQQVTTRNTGAKASGIYSLGFAPPEQVAGNPVYPASDLYALAVTCIVMLTGRLPNQLFDAVDKIWQWQIYADQVDPLLADVLNQMLALPIQQRFQSATAVLQALQPEHSKHVFPTIKPVAHRIGVNLHIPPTAPPSLSTPTELQLP
ncbi:protein kinase domain-containing protein [Pantanalinema rosaneae CENA516]|uniref:protein kinase domain-containing protein n=1 Tax=Pantanalinema rosaneae TaxID=1620701 RepID=UPI003D6E2E06